ncbi:helix-turn-helix domain-containing protein [Thalassomonas viridans]|uniref:Helix-turn-helix domain-containing protein n=1 Tax=Thalassomonas viridans TaxID=137584 RepID=A0AAF0CEI7_9GAMM|nr:helix-turn-helix domain-containing protein [Thalassomonas viridans]WDE08744.1 helix-turn-helix domain-containing protein [Thalassomonas viridans]
MHKTPLPFERMNQRRLELNLAYRAFAEHCNVSQQTVYSWCDGLSEPNAKNVPAICHALQVSSNWLLYGYNSLREFLALTKEEFTALESTCDKSSDYLMNKLIRLLMIQSDINNPADTCIVDMSVNSFHERILTRKNDLNLKESQIAKFCRVDNKSVTNWLNGTSFPRISALKRLVLVLEVPSDWLLTGVVRSDISRLPSIVLKYIFYLYKKLDDKTILTEKVLLLNEVINHLNDIFIVPE